MATTLFTLSLLGSSPLRIAGEFTSELLHRALMNYSQWFAVEGNWVADLLSRDLVSSDHKITTIINSCFPSQGRKSFKVSRRQIFPPSSLSGCSCKRCQGGHCGVATAFIAADKPDPLLDSDGKTLFLLL